MSNSIAFWPFSLLENNWILEAVRGSIKFFINFHEKVKNEGALSTSMQWSVCGGNCAWEIYHLATRFEKNCETQVNKTQIIIITLYSVSFHFVIDECNACMYLTLFSATMICPCTYLRKEIANLGANLNHFHRLRGQGAGTQSI